MTARPGTAVRAKSAQEMKLQRIKERLSEKPLTNYLTAVLPKHVTPDRMTRAAVFAISENPALLNCDPDSIAKSVIKVAVWGLEIGQTAHIVPYGQKATALMDWKGMVELATRGRSIVSCVPTVFYKGEPFEVQKGDRPFIHHTPQWDVPHSDDDALGVYVVVTLPSGRTILDVMGRAEIEAHRDRYSSAWRREKGKRGPWEAQPMEMWKKTIIRRVLKLVPQNPTLAVALAWDEGREERAEEFLSMIAPRDTQGVRSGGYDDGGDEALSVAAEVIDMSAKAPVTARPTRSTEHAPDEYHCDHGVPLTKTCAECATEHAPTD